MESPKEKEFQTKLALNIDEIIDTQLQLHLGQLVWRASESHLEARRFWEEQKKEMFGFAAELVDRLDHRPPPPQCDDEDQQKWKEMESELQKYKLKSAQKQRQLFEMDVLKTRHMELEKEHQEALVQLNQLDKQRMDKASLEERIKDLEEQLIHYSVLTEYHSDATKVDDLVALNKQLKNQLSSFEQINHQLHDQMAEYETTLANQKSKMQAMAQRNKDLEIELTRSNLQVPQVPDEGLDCGEDFGTKKIPTVNWADMMNSEDEVKKWSNKYKSLEKEYTHLCQKLKEVEVKDEKKQVDLLQALNSKEDEIKQLKKASRVGHIQLNHLQQELDKTQTTKRVHTPPPPPPPPQKQQQKQQQQKQQQQQQKEFATKDGYLTFTTEINGRLSTYSIKIPNQQKKAPQNTVNHQQKRLNPNAPAWHQ
jgi:DNA repair exonuclease SbcCD ATPase subunit